MIVHPGIIALNTGSGITVILLGIASAIGIKIMRAWDITNSSETQLLLERRTYLVSVLVQYSLLFEIISLFLFIYTADDLHNLLTGAMCATGSLNANPYGFPALYCKIASLFLASSWIALNFLDNKAEDYPLTRRKYLLLLMTLPLVIAGYGLQLSYFGHIDPDVITSCCGMLFSEGGAGAGSSLASLPGRTMRTVFYSSSLIMIAVGSLAFRGKKSFNLLLAVVSGSYFFISAASIISFISLYFYQLPTHHCPFDILQSEYYYIGYPLYASLFTGSFFGMMTGLAEPLRNIPSLRDILPPIQRRWAMISVSAVIAFVAITLIPMVFMPFTLEGY